MNQKLLGALRAIGSLILFTVLTALVGTIPDVLTQLPVVGGWITPGISAALTALALAYEHQLADKTGYNLPAGNISVPK